MKKHTLEYVIQKLLLEQPDTPTPSDFINQWLGPTGNEKESTYNWRASVVIKSNLSTGGASKSESRDVGAVFTFRVKARALKTDGRVANITDVNKGISNAINESKVLQPYLTGNYIFIRSADQRDSYRNYLFNVWVVPKDYIDDILWVYTDKISKNDTRLDSYDFAVGLPSQGVSQFGRTNYAWDIKNNTKLYNVQELIDKINLNPVSQVIDLPYVDKNRYTRAVNWLKELRTLNAKVDTTDLISPDVLNKPIPNEIYIPKDEGIVIDLASDSIFSTYDQVMFDNGIFNVKTSTPISGDLDGPSATPIYKGTFTPTNKKSKIVLGVPAEADAPSVLYRMNLDTGTATNYYISLDDGGTPKSETYTNADNEVITRYNVTAKYTGTIQNGKLESGRLVFTGNKLKETGQVYNGDFKDNKFYNGIYSENGSPVSRYRNGIETDYVAYEGKVSAAKSSKYYIQALQLEMIAMYDNNTTFFTSKGPTFSNLIEKLRASGPNGIWDITMQNLSYIINTAVLTKEVVELQPNTYKNEIPPDTHKYIILHSTEKIK